MFPKYEYRNSPIHINLTQRATDYPARFHKQLEIAFVESGVLEVSIDNVPYVLNEGDLYVVFPNLLHAGKKSDRTTISIAIVDAEYCAPYTETLCHSKPTMPVLRKNEFSPIVYTIMTRTSEIASSDQPYKQNMLIGYLNALLGEVIQHLTLTRRDSDNDLIQQLILYFLDNYTKDITLDDVAHALNYSKYYISHVIGDTFGTNFRPLINSYRVSMAQSLLLSTNKSVGEIAYECGFKNQSSFNRIFLSHTGSTPSAFRRQQEKQSGTPKLYYR